MARTIRIENIEIIQDVNKLVSQGLIDFKEKFLWCDPLETKEDVDYCITTVIMMKIPFVLAKFDTKVNKKMTRVHGIFVKPEDMWENQSE